MRQCTYHFGGLHAKPFSILRMGLAVAEKDLRRFLVRDQEVGSSNPLAPTKSPLNIKYLQRRILRLWEPKSTFPFYCLFSCIDSGPITQVRRQANSAWQRARAVLLLGGDVLGRVAAGRLWRQRLDCKNVDGWPQCALRGARRRNVFVNNRSSGTC